MLRRKSKIGMLLGAVAGMLVAINLPLMRAEAKEELTGMTAMEITQKMGKGWNLGNTFDATGGNKSDLYSHEKSWGNPKVTKELIDGVAAAGFKTIRIPVTWNLHIDDENNYKIDEAFLNRVKEIVDYAYENDLFVILNAHHEAWINDPEIDSNYKKIGEKLTAVWQQLADYFAEYDQHLIFEGMNEPRAQGKSYEWVGNDACYDAVNYLVQQFVTTVRNNGKGHNPERALMIQGYAASSNPAVLESIRIPEWKGKPADNLIISVHCYSPYNFCLSDAQTSFDPTSTQDTGDITYLMGNLDRLFLSNGLPVVIGECGATNSGGNLSARKKWMAFFSKTTENAGIPAILWDNGVIGNSGGECHNYFVRKTGEMYYPELLLSFIYGDYEAHFASDMFVDFEPYQEDGATVMATPEQYGFEPKNMTKIAKINHTPGAKVGFSAVITKDAMGGKATLAVSRFAGRSVRVEMYLQSKSADAITICVEDGSEQEMIATKLDTGWTKVSFCYTFSGDDSLKSIIFAGAGADDIYLDDVSITLIEESDMTEAYAESEGAADGSDPENAGNNAPDADSQNGDTQQADNQDAGVQSADDASKTVTDASKGGHKGALIGGICGAVALIGGACAVALNRKKKGKSK